MYLYIFLSITFLIFLGIYAFIKMKLNLEGNGLFYAHTNKIHKNGELLIIILFLLLLGIRTFAFNIPLEPHLFIVGIILVQVFRALMEWKFNKSSKRYFLSVLSATFLIILLLSLELFFF